MARGAQRATVQSVQALRGIAALVVVLFHMSVVLPQASPLRDVLSAGYAGVDIFFIISGFVMAYSTSAVTKPGAFLWGRVTRLLPLYILATALYLIVTGFPLDGLAQQLGYAIALLPTDIKPPPFLGTPALHVGWTLTYEMIFYLIFAASLLAGRERLVVAILAIAAITCNGQLWISGTVVLSSYTAPVLSVPYLTMAINPIMLEFCVGILLAVVYQVALPPRFPKWLLVFVGATMVLIGVTRWIETGHYAGYGLTGVGVPAALLVAGFLMIDRAGAFRWLLRPLSLLGAASYSLYLVHLSVLGVTTAILAGPPLAVFLVGTAASVVVAFAAHFAVEKPLLRFFRRGPTARPAVVAPTS